MNIVNLFLDAAIRVPNNVAIIEKDASISYDDLANKVEQTALYFKSKGIKEGDRVLVFVPMGIDLYRMVLALFYLGATAVFLDEWVSKKRLELCCKLANCNGFIGVFKAKVFSWFSSELRRVPIKLNLSKTMTGNLPVLSVNSDTAALITFTTGSTGTPKAALRTHDFLNEQFKALLSEIKPQENDIDMPVLPIVLFVNLGVGCTSVIADFKMTKPQLMNSAKIVNQLKENKVNRIIASPFFVKKLAKYSVDNAVEFPNLNNIFTGGAPVFPMEAKLYKKAFPNANCTIVYGSTEAEPISSIGVDDLIANEHKLDFGLPVGQTYENAEVKTIKIIDGEISINTEGDLLQLELPETEIGEIIVAGHHVLKKYYNNESAFRKNKIVVGNKIWHRTGDSGFFKNKELFLTGRCEQLIVKEGVLLSPFIVENQLQEIDGISMGTIIEHNQNLALVVESKMTEKEAIQKVNDLVFDNLFVIPKIPRDPRHNSKIDYNKLGQVISNS